jgi:hypothetical protein
MTGLLSHGEGTPMPLPRETTRRSLLARVLAWGGTTAILPSLFPGSAPGDDRFGYGISTPTTTPGGPPHRSRGHLFEEVLNSTFRIVPDPESAPLRLVIDPRVMPHPPQAAAHRTARDQQAAPMVLVPDPQAAPRTVVLTSVTYSTTTTKPGGKGPPPTPSYSLIFRDVNGPALSQNTYRVEHAQLGVFPLFLVPIGPKRGEVHYQAILG